MDSTQGITVHINKLAPCPSGWNPDYTTRYLCSLLSIEHGLIELTFMSDPDIHQLNRTHLNHDYPTDVITFAIDPLPRLVTDIYISVDTAKRNAADFSCEWQDELDTLIAHGLLHSLGYIDTTPDTKSIMMAKQDQLLTQYREHIRHKISSYQAVILAAGRGSRVGHSTDHCPKSLLPISTTPPASLMANQLSVLRGVGIDNITIVTGYEHMQFDGLGALTHHYPNWSSTQMMATLYHVKSILSGPTIVLYGDIFYTDTMLRCLLMHPGDIVVGSTIHWKEIWNQRSETPLLDLESFQTDDVGNLRDIGRRCKSYDEIEGQFMGMIACSASGIQTWMTILESQPEYLRNQLDTTTALQLMITSGIPISTCPIEGPWMELDTEHDLNLIRKLYKS